jgi:putative ABC transport system ATP-binding protein
MPNLLEIRDAARHHPDEPRWLLDHVSLGLDAGDRLAVSGPSGSGKTLLLRALAQLDPLDAGSVYWHGKRLHSAGIPSFRSLVVYLHQRAAIFGAPMFGDTVEGALRWPLTLTIHRGRPFDRQRILALVDQLGRGETFLDQPIAGLSGGEMQIVALLRAVQLDPLVLLLDEPTAAIDPAAAAAVEQLVGRWWSEAPQSRAMIWVTHDAAQAERIATRTARMEVGRLVTS